VIVAHHAGEDVLVMAAASGAGFGSLLLAVGRARLAELTRRLRRW
jgi:hypothetical protein